jgi:hypothetical protein
MNNKIKWFRKKAINGNYLNNTYPLKNSACAHAPLIPLSNSSSAVLPLYPAPLSCIVFILLSFLKRKQTNSSSSNPENQALLRWKKVLSWQTWV